MLAFAPRSSFRLLSGEDSLTEYLFNRHVIRHQFCRTGGIECFASGQMPDGTPMVAINVDCLDGVEPCPRQSAWPFCRCPRADKKSSH